MEKKCKHKEKKWDKKPVHCKYRKAEGERFILNADSVWWAIEDSLGEFVDEKTGSSEISRQDVVDLLNKWDKEIRELKRDNKILHDVMDSDVNRAVQNIVDFHSGLREERKYHDCVRFERNTLKKWFMSLNSKYCPTFSKREFDFIRKLENERKKI